MSDPNPRRWSQFWVDLRCWLLGHRDEYSIPLFPHCERCDRACIAPRRGRYPLRDLGKIRMGRSSRV